MKNMWYIFSCIFVLSSFSSSALPPHWNPSTSPHHPNPRYALSSFLSPPFTFLFLDLPSFLPPLCPVDVLSLIPEQHEIHEGLKPLTFCLLPLPLLLFLPRLPSFMPHLISVVLNWNTCRHGPYPVPGTPIHTHTHAHTHKATSWPHIKHTYTHTLPCTNYLRFPVPALKQRLVLHLCGQQKGLRRAWLAIVTLQQYRDAIILLLIQESLRHNQYSLTLDWLQPSHFLKSQARGHRVNISISVWCSVSLN